MLGSSTVYRERMTFVMCLQAICGSTDNISQFLTEAFVRTLTALSQDPIVDVRIRVSRFLSTFAGGTHSHSVNIIDD